VGWLKVDSLSSNPSTEVKRRKGAEKDFGMPCENSARKKCTWMTVKYNA
jgi:hypothetical protein